jgi:transcriptional regulator with XRE-family HTH domain
MGCKLKQNVKWNTDMTIGMTIKVARERIGLKQNEAAELIGVSLQTYNKWENNKTEPKASQIAKLADVIKISPNSICKGNEHHRGKDPLEFMRKFSKLQNSVSEVEFSLLLWESLDDEQEFLTKLQDLSGIPDEAL